MMTTDNDNYLSTNEIFKPISPIIKDLREYINELKKGPNPQDFNHVTDQLARESFAKAFGFQPQAGQIENQNMSVPPNERLNIMLQHNEMKHGNEYYQTEIDELIKASDKEYPGGFNSHLYTSIEEETKVVKDKWFELAEEMEKQELEVITYRIEEKIQQLAYATEEYYDDTEKLTLSVLGSLIEKGCSIKSIEKDIEKACTINLADENERENIKYEYDNNIEEDSIDQATRLVLPTVYIMAESFKGADLAIKIEDEYNIADKRRYSSDKTITINQHPSEVKTKIAAMILSKETEHTKEQDNKENEYKQLSQQVNDLMDSFSKDDIKLSEYLDAVIDLKKQMDSLGIGEIKKLDQATETHNMSR